MWNVTPKNSKKSLHYILQWIPCMTKRSYSCYTLWYLRFKLLFEQCSSYLSLHINLGNLLKPALVIGFSLRITFIYFESWYGWTRISFLRLYFLFLSLPWVQTCEWGLFSHSGGFSITFLIKYKEIKNFIYIFSFS